MHPESRACGYRLLLDFHPINILKRKQVTIYHVLGGGIPFLFYYTHQNYCFHLLKNSIFFKIIAYLLVSLHPLSYQITNVNVQITHFII